MDFAAVARDLEMGREDRKWQENMELVRIALARAYNQGTMDATYAMNIVTTVDRLYSPQSDGDCR